MPARLNSIPTPPLPPTTSTQPACAHTQAITVRLTDKKEGGRSVLYRMSPNDAVLGLLMRELGELLPELKEAKDEHRIQLALAPPHPNVGNAITNRHCLCGTSRTL